MRRTLLLLLLAALILVPAVVILTSRRESAPPDEGIARSLAEERAKRIADLRYDVTFDLPASKAEPIRGRLRASFALDDPGRPLAFDFRQPGESVIAVEANGHAVTPQVVNGHIAVPADALTKGANAIAIEFIAGDEALNRRDEFLYALFVPARASLAMPVMDQPDLKARWTLTLTLPAGWSAVSNGPEAGRVGTPERQTVTFAETPPISTYLFTFAAGRFEIETAERNGRAFRMFHRETDAAKLARNRDAVFDLHARALAWLEDYTDIPYPFGKFDFILIPSFQFGGMEHPGAVFYNASSLLLDESATQAQQLGRASLIAHETAHMWFGDLVTMRWFNDVWMKEVFANFMAAKIVNPSFPEVNHDLRFLYAHYPAAYGVDRTAGANPIRQELTNLNEAGSLYGAIIYQKAPIVMRQLELLIGPEAMRDGLRDYLKHASFGNATWPDLIALLDARSPADLEAWSRAWVEEPGRPAIRTELETAEGRIASLAFASSDPRGRRIDWPQVLRVIVGTPDGPRQFDVAMTGGRAVVDEAAGLPAPAYVLPVGGGLAYGAFELDPATLDYLSRSLHRIDDALTRGAAVVTLWESMLDGRIAPARVTDELLIALPVEADELNVNQMLGYLTEAFWRFTAPDARADLAPRLEGVLRMGLADADSTSAKASWFNALGSLATTRETLLWLERVWRREVSVPGLRLSESDESGLALDLAVRDVPGAAAILAAQHARIENPDRKARFAFVMPAVSADAGERARFFESLKDVRNRQNEAWVLEGARYLHHPLRAETSRPFVVPALALVREIQQTGDIFFPKRWADATLGGYRSPDVAAEVRGFIETLPADYPQRLEWVLIASADPLFRAAAAR